MLTNSFAYYSRASKRRGLRAERGMEENASGQKFGVRASCVIHWNIIKCSMNEMHLNNLEFSNRSCITKMKYLF